MLGAFRGAPTKALEVEAAIMPPEVRFKRLCNRSSLRVLFFNDIHPVKEARSYKAVDELNAEEPVDLQYELRLIKPITQLLALLKRLEQVKHYNTVEKLYTSEETPWVEEFPAKLVISAKPKEEEQKEHIKLIRELVPPEKRIALFYIDGS